jgi:DNA-binding beta-propeller fold protein YncE
VNALRAPSFTDSARSRLQSVAGWPQLPAAITLDRVIGVGVNSRGMIYVAHRGENPLLCLHPDGRLCREVGVGVMHETTAYDLRGPVPMPIATRYWLHGLHIDPGDNVWVTDVGRHLVMKFDAAGALLMKLGVDGESGCDERHFAQPTHVCVAPSGEFFVTDGYGNSRIVKFSAQGKYLLEWGRRGTDPGEFHTPHVIVVGPDGLLYMTDRENDRIQVFDEAGRVRAEWPGLHSVDGLCAGADGFFYGSAGMDHAVLRLDQTGRLLDVWAEPGILLYPHAIARGPDGALYVADSGDVWVVTGRQPGDQYLVPRSGAEGSAVKKLTIQN